MLRRGTRVLRRGTNDAPVCDIHTFTNCVVDIHIRELATEGITAFWQQNKNKTKNAKVDDGDFGVIPQ